MSSSQEQRAGAESEGEVTLSTGETVELPLVTEATMTGAMFAAPRDRVAEMLPDGLTPIRATRSSAAVTFLCVDYSRIGRRGEIVPYNEFGVIFPAVHEGTTTPYLSLLDAGTGGYVWYLPVTSEPAKALGVEIWGYPKVVSDITHEDDGSKRRTTVTVDGSHLMTLTVKKPPTFGQESEAAAYTTKDGTLLCEQTELRGEVGMWPYSKRVSYTFGDHPRAEALADLGLGDRALARFAADVEFVIHEGEPVGTIRQASG